VFPCDVAPQRHTGQAGPGESAGRRRRGGKPQIVTAEDRVVHGLRRHLDHGNEWVVWAQRRGERCQDVLDRGVRGSDGHPGQMTLGNLLRRHLRPLGAGHDVRGDAEHVPACIGESEPRAVAHKETHTEVLFQPLKLPGDRRLRHVESGGRSGDGPVLGDRQEVPQVSQLHDQR
jgi:hypothetical protein